MTLLEHLLLHPRTQREVTHMHDREIRGDVRLQLEGSLFASIENWRRCTCWRTPSEHLFPHLSIRCGREGKNENEINSEKNRWWAREMAHKPTRSTTCLKGGDQKGSLKLLSFLTRHYPQLDVAIAPKASRARSAANKGPFSESVENGETLPPMQHRPDVHRW